MIQNLQAMAGRALFHAFSGRLKIRTNDFIITINDINQQ
jgi:hypothetical protein